MSLLSWVTRTVLMTLAAGCGAQGGSFEERASNGDDGPASEVAAQEAEASTRPVGWSQPSHGDDAPGDYARLFDDARVQRMDVVMTPEVQWTLYDDLTQRIGPPAGTSGSPAAVRACAGKAQRAPCSFLDVSGTCATSGRTLSCRAADQAGAIDMVPGDPTTVPVTIRYEGREWNHVGMRFKGNSSLTGPWRSGARKLGFRLDFDEYEDEHPELKNQRFFGFGKLTFSSNYSDATLIREKLASDLIRDAGLVVARTAFYRLYVDAGNGPEYWGLYTMVEDPSDLLPSTQFPDGSGNLYKPDGPGADFTRFDPRGFEKKSNEKAADYGDVMAAIAALHAPRTDAAAWRRGLEATFDVESFLHNLAITRAIDHWDTYGQMSHNYYLYGDPSQNGRLVWISWDHNMTWTPGRGRTSIVPDNAPERWPLLRFLIADPVYRERYLQLLDEFAGGVYEKAAFDARARALHALVAPFVVGAEGERAPYTLLRSAGAFTSGIDALITTADARRAAIAQALTRPAPAPAP